MGNKKINQKELIEMLCTETWQELYRYIYYKVQNREEAQDITQETYVLDGIAVLTKGEAIKLYYGREGAKGNVVPQRVS